MLKTLASRDFPAVLAKLEEKKTQLNAEAKEEIAQAARKEKKMIEAAYAESIDGLKELIQTAKEVFWLTEKFG